MTNKTICLVLFLFTIGIAFTQSIFDNPITGTNPGQVNPYTSGQTTDPNLTSLGIGRGNAISGENGNNIYNTSKWNGNKLQNNRYFEFTLTPDTGYVINFSSFVYTSTVGTDGPSQFSFRSSLDGYVAEIGTPTSTGATIDLSSSTYQNIETAITFRIYAWGAVNPNRTFGINDFTFNGLVNLSPTCLTTTTWTGSWSNGEPNSLTKNVIINSNYTTTLGFDFIACTLNIANGVTLTIADGTLVEIQNELTVNTGSTISISPYGSLIQNNDASVNIINGNTSVTKLTAPMNNWYEYTFWSSPVSGETIGSGLFESQSNRRYLFNAQNFLDATAETNNNNATNPGQDDVDDNGDDWQRVSGTDAMDIGRGYASMHAEAGFSGAGSQYNYTFDGPFNNGIIPVTVNRNDGSLADSNWNLIGNPYPSPVNIDAFITQNMYNAITNPTGTLEGDVFFWSQNTDFSDTANGNQAYNFDTTDYATYNGTGGTVGADGDIPNGFIPSGQGFFVKVSNNAPNPGIVLFNNAMRSVSLSPDNSQFFKNTNSKKNITSSANKLWVNLTSDNGVFNQILIGYLDAATDGYDGSYFDSGKIVAPKAFAALYSIIENSDKKFAIQGKAITSINENEIIKLGFSTNITVATLFKLSVADFQGEFLAGNTIYLKDNLLNKLHNLSNSDYTFTSEIGEFNSRFEIVFKEQSLSTKVAFFYYNSLKIIELGNNRVQFNISNNLTIKAVSIYDLLGRQLYNFEGNTSSETYTLSNLSNTAYIAKVELSNGGVITKKMVKK